MNEMSQPEIEAAVDRMYAESDKVIRAIFNRMIETHNE